MNNYFKVWGYRVHELVLFDDRDRRKVEDAVTVAREMRQPFVSRYPWRVQIAVWRPCGGALYPVIGEPT